MVSPKQNVNISRISIENFKAFGKRVDVPIRPITLIFGENSSGKSSILHSLLFLNQLQHQPQDKLADITYTEVGGNSVDLGGLAQLKYGHKDQTKLFFSIEKTLFIEDDEEDDEDTHQSSNSEMTTSFQYLFSNNNQLVRIDYLINHLCLCSILLPSKSTVSAIKPSKVKVHVDIDNFIDLMNNSHFKQELIDKLSNRPSLYGRSKFFAADQYVDSVVEQLLPYKGRQLVIEFGEFSNLHETASYFNIIQYIESDYFSDIRFIGINGDIDYRVTNKNRVKGNKSIPTKLELGNVINRMLMGIYHNFQQDFCNFVGDLNNISYIGPIRTMPTHNFDTLDSITRDPSTGSTAWETLASDTYIRDAVNTWLLKFGTNKEITTEQSVDTAQIRKLLATELTKEQILAKIDMLSNRHMLRFYDAKKNLYLSHRDMGVGISQVLPVIVESVANSNTTVLIEQPELHLHPRLQGDLADLFIETAIKGEQQNTYIIETHSEHIIRRIMRRIREDQHKPASDTRITKDDVAILYVANGSNGSTITHLRLDDEGDLIDEWPNGFFEEGFRDDMAGR